MLKATVGKWFNKRCMCASVPNLINQLLESGYAYREGDSIYYRISRFPNYGRLSRLDKRELKMGARIDAERKLAAAERAFIDQRIAQVRAEREQLIARIAALQAEAVQRQQDRMQHQDRMKLLVKGVDDEYQIAADRRGTQRDHRFHAERGQHQR